MAEKMVFWAELSDLDLDFILNDETLLDEFMQAKGSTPVHRISPSPGDLNRRSSVDGDTNMHSAGVEEEWRDRRDNETEAKARLTVSESQDSSTGTIMENTSTGGSANAGIGVMAEAISHTMVEMKVDRESVGSSSSSQIRRAAAKELIKRANAELKPSGFYASNHSERQSDQQQPSAWPIDTVVGSKRKADIYIGNEIKIEAASVETQPEEEKEDAKSSSRDGQGIGMSDGKVDAAVRSRVRFLVNIEDDEDDEDDREGGAHDRNRGACWTDSRQSIVTADRVNATFSGSSSVDHRSYGHYSIDSSSSNKSSGYSSSSASTTTTSSGESTSYNNNHTVSSPHAAGSGSLSKRDSGFWTSLDSLDMKFLANEELALEEYQRFTWGQQQSSDQRSALPSGRSHSYSHPPHSHLIPHPPQQREVNASESYNGTAGGVVGRVEESLSSAQFHHQNPPQVALQVDDYQNLRTQQRLKQLQTQHQNQEQNLEPNQRDGENMDRFSVVPRTNGLQSVYRAPALLVSPNSSLYGYHQQDETQHPPEVASAVFPQPQLRVQQPMGNAHAQHLSTLQAAAPQSSQSFSVPPHAHFASGSNHDINNSSNNIINNNNNVQNNPNLNNNYNSNNQSDNNVMGSSINNGISIRNSNVYNNSDLHTKEAAVRSELEVGTAAITTREFPVVTGGVAAPVRTGDIRERWVFPSVANNGRLVAGSSSYCTSTSNSITINSASCDGGGGGGNGNRSGSLMPAIPQYDHLANANALIQHHLQFLRNQSTSFGRTGVALASAGGSGKSRGKSKSTGSQQMQQGIISRAQPVVAPDLSQSTSMRDVSKGKSSNSSGSNHTSREIIRKTEASHDPAPVETPSSAALAVAAVAAATAAVAVAVAAGNKRRSNDISIGAGMGMTLTGNERSGSAAGLLYDAAAATELLVRQSMLSAGRKYDQRRKRRKTSASSTTGTKKSESKSMKKEINTSVLEASVPCWAPSSPRAQARLDRNITIAATELVTENECIHPDSRDNRIISSSSSNSSSFMMMRNNYELANAKSEAYEGGTDGTEAGGKAGTGAGKWIDKAIISNRSSRGGSDGSVGGTVVEIMATDSDIKTVFANANRVQQAFTAQLVGALNAGSWSKLQQVHRKYCTPGLTASIRYLSRRKAKSGMNATEEPRVSSLHAIIEGLLGGEEMWSKLFKAAPDFLITILSSKLDTTWRSGHNARADEHSFTCSFELSATSLRDTGGPSDAWASDDEEEETRRNTEFNAGVEAKNERDHKATSGHAFSRVVRKTTEEIHCVGSLLGKLNKENRITAYEFSYEDAAVSSLSSATG